MKKFVSTKDSYCDIHHWLAAPYIRKSFFMEDRPEKAFFSIQVSGFYELYINGQHITKGMLAPYINNPAHICYEDIYDVADFLQKGENVVGIILGNGFANQCITCWKYNEAEFRAPLCVSAVLQAEAHGKQICIETDESFKWHDSPILFDMYRYGIYYDARKEIDGWAVPGFDDSDWEHVHFTEGPKGEKKLCKAEPVKKQYELQPVSIEHQQDFYYLYKRVNDIESPLKETYVKDGLLYDFGVTGAGVCRLKVKGKRGQKITLRHGESLRNGMFCMNSIYTLRADYAEYIHLYQADTYILKGGEEEIFIPCFTYHGFRYVLVEGITEKQATLELLTYIVFRSDIQKRADFSCSDETLNKLYQMGIRADESNFVYIPTDCPHREKNGWTGDVAVSAEQFLLNFHCSETLRTWMENIRYAQLESGMLPGIVPTAGWGYHWGNGPRWDSVITEVPYYALKYDGRTDLIEENADMIMRYLHYISEKRDVHGLVACGLGDWCQPGSGNIRISAPLVFTDSCMVLEMSEKAAYMMNYIKRPEDAAFAKEMAVQMRRAIRKHLIDMESCTAQGACQTSQALALYLKLFEKAEERKAYSRLLDFIEEKDRHIDCGMIGLRCIFHVLFEHGDGSLAYEMICRKDAPSYGYMIEKGGTALFEALEDNGVQESQNHHFYGDILNLFISQLVGIQINPEMTEKNHVLIKPHMISQLSCAKATFETAKGLLCVAWEQKKDCKACMVELPEGMTGIIQWQGKAHMLHKGKNFFERRIYK